jgi:uncharacterized protein YecT (DUF1311 family)
MAKANGANPDMIDCIMAEAKQQDARLNENYKRLMSKFSEERKKTLLEAQRAWIRFRDANCAFWDDPAGGQRTRTGGRIDCRAGGTLPS